jgi:adenosylcobinamide-phosphate synthase
MTSAAAQPLLLLVAGLVVDALFGEMPAVFRYVTHPVVLTGRAIAFFDRKLNREDRSDVARRERGIVTVAVLVGGAALLGWAVEQVCRGSVLGAVVEVVLIAVLVAQRSLYEHVAAVAAGLATGGAAGGREAVRHIVGRDPMSLDTHGVARAAIESLAENFSDGVVAPVFWYLLLGLPGLFAYKVANTLDSMIGHRTPRYRAFGWAAARLDDVLNTVPAPLSGLLFAAAAVFRHSPWIAGLPPRLRHPGRAFAGGVARGACYAARLRRGGRAAARSAARSRLRSR